MKWRGMSPCCVRMCTVQNLQPASTGAQIIYAAIIKSTSIEDCPYAHWLHAHATDLYIVSEPDNLCRHQVLIPDPVGVVLLLLGELLTSELVDDVSSVSTPSALFVEEEEPVLLVSDDVSSVSTPSASVVEEEEPWLPVLKESVP